MPSGLMMKKAEQMARLGMIRTSNQHGAIKWFSQAQLGYLV